MKDKYELSSTICKALGHPLRLKIVEGLIKNGCNVMHIVECLKIPQATVSMHLAVLRTSGIIEGERKGTQVCYKVVNDEAKKIVELLL
ncbi:MAG: ArsR/SmtB family transcription factor [Candidatus Xenobiia bacterium LiM19]